MRLYGKLIRRTILDTYGLINVAYRASLVCFLGVFALFLGVFSVTLAPVFDSASSLPFFALSCYWEAFKIYLVRSEWFYT